MTDLKPFNVTIRVFDPDEGRVVGEYVLPVDSPDAEHTAASTMANAASFTTKMDGEHASSCCFPRDARRDAQLKGGPHESRRIPRHR